jgi:hypothetical protein
MVEIRRSTQESYSVQVALPPAPPKGVKEWCEGWHKQYPVGALALDAGKVRTIEGCAQNPETEYLLFKEQGTGFMNYGFNKRVFVGTEAEIEGGVFINKPKDGQDAVDCMRCVDLWTGAVDPTCHYTSIKKWATSKKAVVRAWMYQKEDCDKIRFFMEMEAFKIYCKAFQGWMHNYQFTAQERGLQVWLVCTVLIWMCVGVRIVIYGCKNREAKDLG